MDMSIIVDYWIAEHPSCHRTHPITMRYPSTVFTRSPGTRLLQIDWTIHSTRDTWYAIGKDLTAGNALVNTDQTHVDQGDGKRTAREESPGSRSSHLNTNILGGNQPAKSAFQSSSR
jgi:hypothetical protein